MNLLQTATELNSEDCYHQTSQRNLVSGSQPETLLVSRDHAAASFILIWEIQSQYVTWAWAAAKGDSLFCCPDAPGVCVDVIFVPVSPQGGRGTMCDEIRGPHWARSHTSLTLCLTGHCCKRAGRCCHGKMTTTLGRDGLTPHNRHGKAGPDGIGVEELVSPLTWAVQLQWSRLPSPATTQFHNQVLGWPTITSTSSGAHDRNGPVERYP